MPRPQANWLTVSQAAKLLHKSESRVRQDCLTTRLTAAKLGRDWRIDPKSVDELKSQPWKNSYANAAIPPQVLRLDRSRFDLLTPRQREAVELLLADPRLSYERLGERLGISRSGVYYLIVKAGKRLGQSSPTP